MSAALRILYLDDDVTNVTLVRDTLARDQMASVVSRVETEPEFRAALQHGKFDLILSACTLPSFDGLSAVRIARQQCPDVPFIFVSGNLGEEVAIEALTIGATDYVLTSRLSRLVPSVQRGLREAKERAELRRSEEALRRSEFYLAEGERLTRIGSWGFNPAGFFDYWSEELFRIYGLDPKDGAPTLERYLGTIHPQDREFMAGTIRRMHAESVGCDVKKRIIRPDGTLRFVRCVGVPILENGMLKGFLGTAMDVTEQEQLTQRLRRSKAYLDEAQRLSQTGSFGWKPATGEIVWSEETHRIFDLDRATKPTIEFIVSRTHPEDRESVQQLIARATSEGRDWDLEHRLLMPGGGVKHLHIVARATHDDATGETEFIGAVMDVSQRQRDEAALRRSEEYLKEAQRMTRMGSWACNFITQQLLHTSDESARIYGLDPTQDVTSFERYYNATHPEDEPAVRATLEKAIRTGTDFDLDFRILRPDGSLRHVRVIGHPFGEAGEYLGTTMDVTERKHAEEERDRLRQLEANLAHVNRVTTMGELTASLAHEVNQPIAAAVTDANTCLRWLRREHPDLEEAREAATRTVKDAMRAADIIRQMRRLFTKSGPAPEVVTVNELITEIVTLVRSEAMRYGVAIRTELVADLPFVSGDRIQLQQVLLNLMINGIESMKGVDGERELTLKSARDGEQLLVSVADTGVGLPANRDEIFNAFYTTKPDGTGMGLAISRSIIESHGGRLWAMSNADRGATFCFRLPVTVAVQA